MNKGRFRVSQCFINPKALLKIMKKFLIIAARYDWQRDFIEYTALSDLFDKVEDGENIPLYEIWIGESLKKKYTTIDISVKKLQKD